MLLEELPALKTLGCGTVTKLVAKTSWSNPSAPMVWLLGGLAGTNIILILLDWLNILPALWQISLLAYFLLTFLAGMNIRHTFRESAQLRDLLEQLAGIFRLLEGAPNLEPLP